MECFMECVLLSAAELCHGFDRKRIRRSSFFGRGVAHGFVDLFPLFFGLAGFFGIDFAFLEGHLGLQLEVIFEAFGIERA